MSKRSADQCLLGGGSKRGYTSQHRSGVISDQIDLTNDDDNEGTGQGNGGGRDRLEEHPFIYPEDSPDRQERKVALLATAHMCPLPPSPPQHSQAASNHTWGAQPPNMPASTFLTQARTHVSETMVRSPTHVSQSVARSLTHVSQTVVSGAVAAEWQPSGSTGSGEACSPELSDEQVGGGQEGRGGVM